MSLRAAIAIGIGALSVVSAVWGVPALMRRQYQTEAIQTLAKLSRTASIYFVKPRGDETGNRMLCQFPQGEIRSTLAKSCCDPSVNNGDGLCDPAKMEWNRTLWLGLRFQPTEAHAYVYEYKASGTLAAAKYELSAYGDLDCDGVYSTFRFIGHGSKDSSPIDCILTESAEFQTFSPEE